MNYESNAFNTELVVGFLNWPRVVRSNPTWSNFLSYIFIYYIENLSCQYWQFRLVLAKLDWILTSCETKDPAEFSINVFHWIQQIQWITTKSKIGLVTKISTHLTISTLPVVVILRAFPLQPLVWWLLLLTTLNRCQTRDSNGNFFFTTAWRNTSFVRYGLSFRFSQDSLKKIMAWKFVSSFNFPLQFCPILCIFYFIL